MKTYFIMLFACVFLSCGNKYSNVDIETIDINKCFSANQLDIVRNKYAYDGFVVKLETTDDCLLRQGGMLIFSDNRIFVKQETVYIFDFEGHFINKLKIGNGQGEISNVSAIDFDTEKNELVLYQKPYIKFYSPDGTFLREQESQYYFSYIKSIDEGYILQSDAGYMQCKEKPKATLLLVDKNFNLKSAHLNLVEKFVYYDMKQVCCNATTNEISIPNRNDTIYFLKNSKLVPKYKLDYSTCKFDYSVQDFDAWDNEGNNHYAWWWYFETTTHQFFGLEKEGIGCNIFCDKLSKKLYAGKYYDYNALFDVVPKAVFKDYFVSVNYYRDVDCELEKLDLFSAEDLAKIHNQTPEDNPLLIFYKLKPFGENN